MLPKSELHHFFFLSKIVFFLRNIFQIRVRTYRVLASRVVVRKEESFHSDEVGEYVKNDLIQCGEIRGNRLKVIRGRYQGWITRVGSKGYKLIRQENVDMDAVDTEVTWRAVKLERKRIFFRLKISSKKFYC